MTEFVEGDYHHQKRTNGLTYLVQTVTLLDLLKENFAPKEIHYLSIDTEGSEFEIIRNFDFQEYKIHIISIEHNYTPAREKIFTLLTSHGYDRVLSQVSHFDDWYVLTR